MINQLIHIIKEIIILTIIYTKYRKSNTITFITFDNK